jgi:hypothetical protein
LATQTVEGIADFASGTGNLLYAAKLKWPKANLYANDIDVTALQELSHRLPCARIDCSDFLSTEFHFIHSGDLAKWSLILLNPPFSQREVAVHEPIGKYSGLRCSRSMAFVMSAVPYLATGGQLLAILPSSTLTSRIDNEARELLRKSYFAEVVRLPAYGLFDEADVSTYFLRISSLCQPVCVITEDGMASQNWQIMRGGISMPRKFRVKTVGKGWVHTTALKSGRISHRYKFPTHKYGRIAPAGTVLLPRVGRFDPDKIATAENDEYISDCIFGISHPEISSAVVLNLLLQNLEALSHLYGGTGAPYLSRSRLQNFLSTLV